MKEESLPLLVILERKKSLRGKESYPQFKGGNLRVCSNAIP